MIVRKRPLLYVFVLMGAPLLAATVAWVLNKAGF